jgi:hypothetical protein
MERRTLQTTRPRLVRAEGGQPPRIEGYAAVYYRADDPGTEYELFADGNYSVCERLMPGCFDRSVKEDDVRALFNHDVNNILGRMKSGTLRLSSDGLGLRYEIDPPDTQMARDLMESIKRGDVTGSSFSFDYLSKDIILQQDGDKERDIIEVRDVKLYDTGPVTFPAYASTTAEARRRQHSGGRHSPEAMRRRASRLVREAAVLAQRDAAPCLLSREVIRQLDRDVAAARRAVAARRICGAS